MNGHAKCRWSKKAILNQVHPNAHGTVWHDVAKHDHKSSPERSNVESAAESAAARSVLARAIEDRRAETGKSWREIERDGDISRHTIRAILDPDNFGRSIRLKTRRGIERGLGWPTRHIDRILGEITTTAPTPEDTTERELLDLAKRGGLGEQGAARLINYYRAIRESNIDRYIG